MNQLVLQHLALADVTDVEHHTGDAGLVEETSGDDLGVTPAAGVVTQPAAQRNGLPALEHLGEEVAPALQVGRMQQRLQRSALQ